jgi:hypothetical protein
MDCHIAKYLEGQKNKLAELYSCEFNTKIPLEKFGILIKGDTWFEKTINLKLALRKRIEEKTKDQNELEKIATYFIKDWGGIRRFSKPEEVVEMFGNMTGTDVCPKDFKPTFKSISSWSKWASLVCPKWACVYDARVAYSINAINYLSGGVHKIFPIPEGRNTRLNLFDVSTLILSAKIKETDKSEPKFIRKSYFVADSAAYIEYLSVVRGVSQRLWNDHEHIHEVEMLLFALADIAIYESVFARIKVDNYSTLTANNGIQADAGCRPRR